MLKLGVNIDHVATLRQARGGKIPDPLEAAKICEKAGADSLVMHLREDRRHVQDSDLFKVKDAIKIKLNMEMSIAPEIVKVALALRPDQVTFVPENRRERTTESGLDLIRTRQRVRKCIDLFKSHGVVTSLFIDPDPDQAFEAKKMGADAVEFHTGVYADAASPGKINHEWFRVKKAVGLANQLGIVAHAGHGLDYENVRKIKKIKGLDELNIGYSIITRALWVGLDQAVREMKNLVGK